MLEEVSSASLCRTGLHATIPLRQSKLATPSPSFRQPAIRPQLALCATSFIAAFATSIARQQGSWRMSKSHGKEDLVLAFSPTTELHHRIRETGKGEHPSWREKLASQTQRRLGKCLHRSAAMILFPGFILHQMTRPQRDISGVPVRQCARLVTLRTAPKIVSLGRPRTLTRML